MLLLLIVCIIRWAATSWPNKKKSLDCDDKERRSWGWIWRKDRLLSESHRLYYKRNPAWDQHRQRWGIFFILPPLIEKVLSLLLRLAVAKARRRTIFFMVTALRTAEDKVSYGALVREQRTQDRSHFEARLLRRGPLSSKESISSKRNGLDPYSLIQGPLRRQDFVLWRDRLSARTLTCRWQGACLTSPGPKEFTRL